MIPLYRNNPYLFTHQTIADSVQDDGETQLVICREQIFAEGGGQPPDHGAIFWNGVEQPVIEIIKEKGNSALRICRIEGLKKGPSSNAGSSPSGGRGLCGSIPRSTGLPVRFAVSR